MMGECPHLLGYDFDSSSMTYAWRCGYYIWPGLGEPEQQDARH